MRAIAAGHFEWVVFKSVVGFSEAHWCLASRLTLPKHRYTITQHIIMGIT